MTPRLSHERCRVVWQLCWAVGWRSSRRYAARDGEPSGRDLKSLLLGYYEDPRLVFAGRVGTGFSVRVERDLLTRLGKLQRRDSPFVSVPREFSRGATWAEPRLVVAVKFTTWTRDGILRHPSFDGICEGTAPESVVIERPAFIEDAES